jgi:hypothetical protein
MFPGGFVLDAGKRRVGIRFFVLGGTSLGRWFAQGLGFVLACAKRPLGRRLRFFGPSAGQSLGLAKRRRGFVLETQVWRSSGRIRFVAPKAAD